MARIARVVVPGVPHHVTQRGNRRLQTFFTDEDYSAYLGLMAEWCKRCGVEVWAYCLMPNHVHLIAAPSSEHALARAIGEAHRRYTRMINFREAWRGHLWQERFASFPMDDGYAMLAARYVELNPVRARLVRKAWRWRWSSAQAHVQGQDDKLVKVAPLLERVEDWREYLCEAVGDEEATLLRQHARTGRPLGRERFLKKVEKKLGRELHRRKPGPKPRELRR